MALSEKQFNILKTVITEKNQTQRKLAKKSQISLGEVNTILKDFKLKELVDSDNNITEAGMRTLQPYHVDNAIIMAAGMGTRFAPLSYEKPKALLKVKGEVMIERQIRQLQAAGIKDITVVVGYMKEKMYYLADNFNVNIVVNEDYYRYNNTSTLMHVLDKLSNTYICSSDDYFTENVFEPYVYRSYYSAVYAVGPTDEYCMTCARDGRIKNVTVGGKDSWYMFGHVYWDKDFSTKFKEILKREYDQPLTKSQLWEDLYMRHINELDLYIKKYPNSVIKEFDSLDELRAFDKDYIENVDSKIFKNIESVLHCDDRDINHIIPIKTGLTNTSFHFDCKGKSYVYRQPGLGTEKYINRASEAATMKIAKKYDLDDTFIYMDPKEGWKISHFIKDTRTLDYSNKEQVEQALHIVRKLHTCGEKTIYDFNIWDEIDKFYKTLHESKRDDFEGAQELKETMDQIRTLVEADNVPKCLCHCDCYNPNFLIDKDDKMYLIDWEYSGMADPAVDIGTFVACSPYDMDQADSVVETYLGYKPDKKELRHFIGYIAILSYYWFVWSLYQESIGKPVGSWQYKWYTAARKYGKRALSLYEEK